MGRGSCLGNDSAKNILNSVGGGDIGWTFNGDVHPLRICFSSGRHSKGVFNRDFDQKNRAVRSFGEPREFGSTTQPRSKHNRIIGRVAADLLVVS